MPNKNSAEWPVARPAEDVFSFVKGIIETGQEDEFLKMCRSRKFRVLLHPDDMRALKAYVVERDLHATNFSLGNVVDPPKCDC